MSERDLAKVVEPILRRWLRPYGFLNAEVSSGRDHDGEPSLFITAHYSKRDDEIDPDAILDATAEIQQVLLKQGDERFPYIRHHIPDPAHVP